MISVSAKLVNLRKYLYQMRKLFIKQLFGYFAFASVVFIVAALGLRHYMAGQIPGSFFWPFEVFFAYFLFSIFHEFSECLNDVKVLNKKILETYGTQLACELSANYY